MDCVCVCVFADMQLWCVFSVYTAVNMCSSHMDVPYIAPATESLPFEAFSVPFDH